ncbi:MAG: hypothetical protein JO001_15710 [Alphaproteobacteria bacterium]|nr:hypothetical protein [Alphaproteobacteria bacterium]
MRLKLGKFARGRPVNGLMLAFAFSLPYHVLRTATAAGVTVHVLGSGPSKGLRASRYCASYRNSGVDGNGPQDAERVLADISALVRRHRIELIFPSDDVSTRLLAAIRSRLPVRTTLLPDVATFDLLNNKDSFCRFARDQGARVPETRLYATLSDLKRDLRSGALSLPLTVKPTNRSGGVGVMHIRDRDELAQLESVFYAPVLAQRFIAGKTIGLSVMCRDGRILMHAAQWYDHRRFTLFDSPDLLANAERVVSAARLDGPAHFDAILEDATGLAHLVECNPRFWFSMYMPGFVGLNFFAAACDQEAQESLPPITLTSADINRNARVLLARPWRGKAPDWRYLAYQHSDPAAFLLQRAKAFDDRDVAVELRGVAPEAIDFAASRVA